MYDVYICKVFKIFLLHSDLPLPSLFRVVSSVLPPGILRMHLR